MPGVDNKQPREAIEVFSALVVPNVVALALDDDGYIGALGHRTLAGEVHPQVVAGLVLEGFGFLAQQPASGRLLCRWLRSGLRAFRVLQ